MKKTIDPVTEAEKIIAEYLSGKKSTSGSSRRENAVAVVGFALVFLGGAVLGLLL